MNAHDEREKFKISSSLSRHYLAASRELKAYVDAAQEAGSPYRHEIREDLECFQDILDPLHEISD